MYAEAFLWQTLAGLEEILGLGLQGAGQPAADGVIVGCHLAVCAVGAPPPLRSVEEESAAGLRRAQIWKPCSFGLCGSIKGDLRAG